MCDDFTEKWRFSTIGGRGWREKGENIFRILYLYTSYFSVYRIHGGRGNPSISPTSLESPVTYLNKNIKNYTRLWNLHRRPRRIRYSVSCRPYISRYSTLVDWRRFYCRRSGPFCFRSRTARYKNRNSVRFRRHRFWRFPFFSPRDSSPSTMHIRYI